MKLNKIVLPLALALAAMLSTTGCKHGFNGKVTTLPGHRTPVPSDTGGNQNTLPPGNQLPPGDNANANANPFGASANPNGTFPTTTDWTPENMNQDRDKLAAFTVHFKFDSAVVQDSEQANLAGVGQALTSDPNAKLLIEGHCDERGTEEYNRSLGERRALALREALAKDGVDPMRVRTISYGKDKPVDPGHDEAAWTKNRRGEFIYCTAKTPVQ
ncbi:MAG TPA: OmpA family protein [Verrucomicrobiae bacterium]|jgi:peptidoglycan-associated lipoprotein|nr:OmpA family protein [Verrucomicrobiae bacterium]